MNIRRLWAVVSPVTNEVVYSSFDYNRAKKAYDHLLDDLISEEDPIPPPSFGRLMGYKFCRYDLSPHYSFSDCVQNEANKTVRDFLDFILMKSRDNANNNKNNNTTIKEKND